MCYFCPWFLRSHHFLFFILVLVTPVYANVVPILGCWSLLKSGLANTLQTGGFQRIPTTLHEAAWNHYGPVSSCIYVSSCHSLLSPSRLLMPTVPKHSYKVEGSNGNTTKSVRNKLQTVETQPFLGGLFLPIFFEVNIFCSTTPLELTKQ